MNRIAVSAIALAISAAAAGAAVAGYQDYGRASDSRYSDNSSRTDYAQVVRVEPAYDRYSTGGYERQECWNEQTNAYDNGYYRDSNGRLYQNGRDSNANGTIIGALIGGALGNQVGKGDGRTAATVAGAVIGGAIGNNVDRNHTAGYADEYRDQSGVVRKCRQVSDNGGRFGGYDVTYRYAGQTYHALMNYRPSRTMRVMVQVRPQFEGGVATRY